MAKVITFGELMLRLQPYNYERFVQCDHVEFTFGGGEANVAVSLHFYPVQNDAAACNGCAICALMCPEAAIEVAAKKA